MKRTWNKQSQILTLSLGMVVFSLACGLSSSATPTPTPTLTGGEVSLPTPTPIPDQCQGLTGEFEMQALVGPAEGVGLEPIAVGYIPFSVVTDGDPYLVQGSGLIDYEDVLAREWGTYTVNFDLEAVVSGECQGDEQSGVLNVVIETSGEQNVEVISEGFQAQYPWSGTHSFDLSFPLEEGATAAGEGWSFVLHLSE